MRALDRKGRGSGLIVVLAVLAMLAIMATTFVTLTRLETRVATNYADDFRCEMLARGMLSYFKGILRDGSNRQFQRYNNRETSAGFYGWGESGVYAGIQGLDPSWGTGPSRAFWFYQPAPTWGDLSAMFGNQADYTSWCSPQGTFNFGVGSTSGRLWDATNNREVECWIDRAVNAYDASRGIVVDYHHPNSSGEIDDNMDGTPSPTDTVWGPLYYGETRCDSMMYFDGAPFITSSAAGSKFFPGNIMTGEATLPGGTYWRWAAKMGIPTTAYLDLNMAGNLDGDSSARAPGGYLDNMGARRALDETSDRSPYTGTTTFSSSPHPSTDHLGRIEWMGFPGDVAHDTQLCNVSPYGVAAFGFPWNYNAVFWHPNQLGLEKTFLPPWIPTETPLWRHFPPRPVGPPGSSATLVLVGREKARALIQVRSGRADGRPGDGSDRWRVGWRRDGASYYKLPNPDNPIGSEHYFGTNEIIEHDHSTYHGRTSAISNVLGKWDERAIRPYCSLYAADTTLRGKIWPDEGPLPWRPAATQAGDWGHIDILKRVNLNIIGAKGANGRPGDPTGDEPLKNAWALKAQRERDRLYYMLVAAMHYTNTADRQKKACQFIASLTDMVDRDHDETFYLAPDGSGAWGLGVEKFPVINEVAFYCGRNASAATWELTSLRVELCNTAENIPWIPDADEAYDVSNYVLRFISSLGSPRTYRLGTLRHYDATSVDLDLGPVTTIGADGIYADPNDATKKTWSRLLHVGWPKVGTTWWPPDGITQTEMRGSIKVQLWKPLTGDAQNNITADGVNVATIMGGSQKYLRVDEAGPFWLVGPYGGWAGPGGTYLPTYLGLYRRWDPMNAKPFGSPSFSTNFSSTAMSAWVQGANLASATLGKPNYGYGGTTFGYRRLYERNFKVVDGDLPSIGWLGELITWNTASDGPLTQIHGSAVNPALVNATHGGIVNDLDIKAKFDLYRPFLPLTGGPHYDPSGVQSHPDNLHVLDIFTVWDPSNDGVDNDGDGAVDDADTGLQPGDKGGPEVRVYGRLNMNHIPSRVFWSFLPNNEYMYSFYNDYGYWSADISTGTWQGRQGPRSFIGNSGGQSYTTQGPYETIGDVLRCDKYNTLPGQMWSSYNNWNPDPSTGLGEIGIPPGAYQWSDGKWYGDDDGDGVFDERDERDMLFTWASNFLTTRSNVFQIDLNVDICDPPYHPGPALPFKTYKTRRSYARKQLLGVLDRSTMLRVRPDGTCDFGGPVDVRLLRFSDDLRID